MLISIDNRDMAYTIDTYGMFTGEGSDESEVDYYDEEYKLTERFPDLEIGFNYNHDRIVSELAGWSIAIIEREAHDEKWLLSMPIIKKFGSPQFYNYTTDHYVADWNVDEEELDKVLPENWLEVAQENGWTSIETFEDRLVAKIDTRLREVLSIDSYNEEMWEHESEVYTENMTPDEETQKAIDSYEEVTNVTA